MDTTRRSASCSLVSGVFGLHTISSSFRVESSNGCVSSSTLSQLSDSHTISVSTDSESSTLMATSIPVSTSRPRKTRPNEPSPSVLASAAMDAALRSRAASSLHASLSFLSRFTSETATSDLLPRSSFRNA